MNDSTSIRDPRFAIKVVGHVVATVSLCPEDSEWIDSVVKELTTLGAEGVNRSLVVRAALRQLKSHLEKKEPGEVLAIFKGAVGYYRETPPGEPLRQK